MLYDMLIVFVNTIYACDHKSFIFVQFNFNSCSLNNKMQVCYKIAPVAYVYITLALQYTF